MDFKAFLAQLNNNKIEYLKGVGTPVLVLAALAMVAVLAAKITPRNNRLWSVFFYLRVVNIDS